ncbi:hypothetical protein ACHHYP_07185 [Achlya hypogyna]|uniref:Letm1 RBD domain-containing protein n=1 Tax=Achlya hypogyna TaxID=1202772 RepID=A0A1V9ZMJ6_ACHHY|nr:hypothetical protein ACHHYP_07185 [Achlya hypogyna]
MLSTTSRVARGRPSPILALCLRSSLQGSPFAHLYSTSSKETELSPLQKLKLWLAPFTNGASELVRENKDAWTSRRRLYEHPDTVLTRREMFVLRQAPRDLLKSIPLLLAFGVPLLGNLAPVIGYKFPKLTLPWQFWTPAQKAQFFSEDVAKKSAHYGDIARLITTWDPFLQTALASYLESKEPRAKLDPKVIVEYQKLFEGPGMLEKLPTRHLQLLVLATSASPFVRLYTYLPRAKLIDRLQTRSDEIGIDDRLLLKEGLEALSPNELAFACEERGLVVDFADVAACRSALQEWLTLYNPDENTLYPASLILHAPIVGDFKKITAPMTRGISRSARRMGEDHGHEHRVFEDGPFNAKAIGSGIIAIVGGGAVVTVGCCKFQNYKHGFPQKKEE